MSILRVTRAVTASDLEQIEWLNTHCFPADFALDFPPGSHWWLAVDGDQTVGFAGVHLDRRTKTAKLLRAGVRKDYQGKGLQRRFITARERLAKSEGMKTCRTYTSVNNTPSMRNLARLRYRPYFHTTSAAIDGFVSWSKEF